MISEQLCLTAYRPCPRSWPQILYLPPAFTPILASQTVGMAVVVVGRQMSEVTWTKGGSARTQDSFPPAPLCLAHPIRPQKLFTDRASHRETQNCWELGEVRLTWRKCPGIDSWCQTAAVFAWCWAWAAQVGSRQVKALKGVSQDPRPPGQGHSDRADREAAQGHVPTSCGFLALARASPCGFVQPDLRRDCAQSSHCVLALPYDPTEL